MKMTTFENVVQSQEGKKQCIGALLVNISNLAQRKYTLFTKEHEYGAAGGTIFTKGCAHDRDSNSGDQQPKCIHPGSLLYQEWLVSPYCLFAILIECRVRSVCWVSLGKHYCRNQTRKQHQQRRCGFSRSCFHCDDKLSLVIGRLSRARQITVLTNFLTASRLRCPGTLCDAVCTNNANYTWRRRRS